MTPEIAATIAALRQKILAGTLTREDELQAVRILREGRLAAQVAATSSKAGKAKSSAPAISGDDLLDEMLG